MTSRVAPLALAGLALAGCSSASGDADAEELDPSKPARCFTIAKPRGDGGPGPRGPAVPAAPSADPVEACARLWERGEVRVGTADAPPLRACVGATGRPLVVPYRKREVCSRLGLTDPRYRPPAGKPGFDLDRIPNDERRAVRSHSRRFCSAGRAAVADALETKDRRGAVLRALARGYPKSTRQAARKGCRAGLRDAR